MQKTFSPSQCWGLSNCFKIACHLLVLQRYSIHYTQRAVCPHQEIVNITIRSLGRFWILDNCHQASRGSTCNPILIEERWYAPIAQQQISYASTKWHLWAEFKSLLKGSPVTLKLDYVIPSASPKLQTGKVCSSFSVITGKWASKFNANMCEKSYQRFTLYHTSLSINSKELMQVLKLKTVTVPWLQGAI